MHNSPIGQPCLISESNDGKVCQSLSRISPNGKEFQEMWLQEVLDANPSLLPTMSVDERVQEPLVSLGREIPTQAGPIDNLFISRSGHLVVVETKLWRNQESRRKVVAQILDYAAHLRRWSYSDLEKVWQRTSGNTTSLWEYVHPDSEMAESESEWIDEVNENLSRGRMLLLIVGDGIRSESSALVEAVSGHPSFEFRLGLIELRLHRLNNGQILAIPTLQARTVEIERVVVDIRQDAKVKVTIAEQPQSASTTAQHARTSALTSEDFFERLRRLDPSGTDERVARRLLTLFEEAELLIEWQQSSFSIKLPEPTDSDINFSLATVNLGRRFGCYFSCLEPQLKRAWGDSDAVGRVLEHHRQGIIALGASGKKDLGMPLSCLDEREEQAVRWIEGSVDFILQQAQTF